MSEIADVGIDSQWHVSRSIPIAWLISSFVWGGAQIGVFGWYASELNSRVDAIEKAQSQAAPQGERLTRLEEKVGSVQSGVTDLKADLKVVSQTLATIAGQSTGSARYR